MSNHLATSQQTRQEWRPPSEKLPVVREAAWRTEQNIVGHAKLQRCPVESRGVPPAFIVCIFPAMSSA